jgi:ElaB/YqjD/DUF883 family membrane-anchored ribosome-binding protein
MDESEKFEVIKQQMEERRSSLADKLDALETQVSESVQEVTSAVSTVKEAVQDTVDTVKGSVQDTVEAVKETFDLSRQMENHPWIMMGGAFALGFLGGRLVSSSSPRISSPGQNFVSDAADWRNQGSTPGFPGGYSAQQAAGQQSPNGHHRSSWFQSLGNMLAPELDKLKGMALGTALGLVRDTIKQSAPPQLGAQLAEVIDSLTTKLGGQPSRDNLVGKSGNAAGYHFSDSR